MAAENRNGPGTQPETCPICMDTYRNPKILPCSHTMCQECLENMLASGYKSDLLVCPICRQPNQVPAEGVGKFLPNYFVPTSSGGSICTCNVCDAILSDFQKKSGRCSYCDGQMCTQCYQKHSHPENEMRGFQRTTSQEDEYSDGLDLDGSHRNTLRNLMLQLQDKAQSVLVGRMVNSFQCEQQSAQPIKITNIVATDDNKMWILVGNGPFIIKYDSQGLELERKFVDGKLLDIALHKDGSLLMVLDNYHSVMAYTDAQIREYVSTTDRLSPQCILMLPTGFLVVTAVNVNSTQQESVILVYNSEGTVINTIQCHQRGLAYGTITSLASNLNHGHICIADEKRQCVFFLREGKAPLSYSRPHGAFPTRNRGGQSSNPRYRGFKPKSLACDSKGNVFVYDDASGMIHVLNSSAKLLGLVLTNDEELTGNPNCIAIDSRDRLLVGDELSGKVRIYEIEAIYNDLGQIEEDAGAFFASMQQRLTDAGGGGIQELVDISSQFSVNPDTFLNAVLNHQEDS